MLMLLKTVLPETIYLVQGLEPSRCTKIRSVLRTARSSDLDSTQRKPGLGPVFYCPSNPVNSDPKIRSPPISTAQAGGEGVLPVSNPPNQVQCSTQRVVNAGLPAFTAGPQGGEYIRIQAQLDRLLGDGRFGTASQKWGQTRYPQFGPFSLPSVPLFPLVDAPGLCA